MDSNSSASSHCVSTITSACEGGALRRGRALASRGASALVLAAGLGACASDTKPDFDVPPAAPTQATDRRVENLLAEFEREYDCSRTKLDYDYVQAEDVHVVAGCGERHEYWLACPPGCSWEPLDKLRPVAARDLGCNAAIAVEQHQDYLWKAHGCGKSGTYMFLGGEEQWRPYENTVVSERSQAPSGPTGQQMASTAEVAEPEVAPAPPQ